MEAMHEAEQDAADAKKVADSDSDDEDEDDDWDDEDDDSDAPAVPAPPVDTRPAA